jgi:uncharacterized protein YecE (DUF72 family)
MLRVGIGGWTYAPWRDGVFFPPKLAHAEELSYASRHVTAIEVNGTFYRTQTPATFRKWHDETPDDFVFTLKGPRYVSFSKEPAKGIDKFLESGLEELGRKLGAILWQLPPSRRFEAAWVEEFLGKLPGKMRHAIEATHMSFSEPEAVKLLAKHKIAHALVDDEDVPESGDTGTPFVYARLKNARAEIETGYPPEELRAWHKRFRGKDGFVFFINGAKERAPAAAQEFLKGLSAT